MRQWDRMVNIIIKFAVNRGVRKKVEILTQDKE